MLRVAQEDLEPLKPDLDMIRTERDNALKQVQRSATAEGQAEAAKPNCFIRFLPPLLFIAIKLCSPQSTPPAFANAVRSAVPASFELPPPGSSQFVALVPVILAAAVLTSPQMPNLDDPAGVLRQAVPVASPMAIPDTLMDAPNISFCRLGPRSQTPGSHSRTRVLLSGRRHLHPPPSTPRWPPFWNGSSQSHGDVKTPSTSSCSATTARALAPSFNPRCGINGHGSASTHRAWPASRTSCAPSLPALPQSNKIVGSPAASPAEADAANQAEGAAKKKGYTPQKVDPQVFSKALWVGWQEIDAPLAREVDTVLLGGILLDKFGAGLASISDAQLNRTAKFTIVGVTPVDYDKGMKRTRHHIARGWKMSWAESKKQLYTPWAADPDREYPARKAHRGGRGQKIQRKQDLEEEVDLTAAWNSDGEPEAKHHRRYSPRRSGRSPPRRRSPGYRHDSPAARRRSAYRDEQLDPREHSGHHDRHAPAPPPALPLLGGLARPPGCHGAQPLRSPALEPPSRPTPLPAVLRTSSEGPLE